MVALGIGVAGLLLFAAVGYIAYPALMNAAKKDAATAKDDDDEKAPATVAAPTKAPKAAEPPPVPSFATKPAVPAPVVATPPPVAPPPVAATTPPVAEGPPEPSNAFKAWVTNLKITATRAGANPRLFVGGKSFNRGDVVNADLGITFDAYDDERHMIRFKDATGATFERRR